MEIWKDIKGYEGQYQVSNLGRIKSLCWGKERILKPNKDRYGYLQLNLYKYGQCRRYSIHRLVANAFIDNPDNKPEVNHIDENKTNNTVINLEWVTSKENSNHGTRNERMAKTQSKPVIAISKDKKNYLYFNSAMDAQRLGGFNQSHVSASCIGERKTHKGYTWMYVDE